MNWHTVFTFALVSFASFVAGAWFASVLLRRETVTRRPGYVKLPASAGTNRTTVRLVPTSTSSSPPLGKRSVAPVWRPTLAEWSKQHGPSFCGRAPEVPGAETGRRPPESAAPREAPREIAESLRVLQEVGDKVADELVRRGHPDPRKPAA